MNKRVNAYKEGNFKMISEEEVNEAKKDLMKYGNTVRMIIVKSPANGVKDRDDVIEFPISPGLSIIVQSQYNKTTNSEIVPRI